MSKDEMKSKNNSQNIITNKRHNKYQERKSSTIFFKIISKLIIIIIFYNSIVLTEEKPFKLRNLENSSTIKLIIRGNGTKNIVGDEFGTLPSEVCINGIKRYESQRSYFLEKEVNEIILKIIQIIVFLIQQMMALIFF